MKRILLILFTIFCLAAVLHTVVSDVSDTKKIIVEETGIIQLEVKALDPDGDPLTYTFSPPLDENGRWQTDYGDEGEYLVNVTVSDGKVETTEMILIVVKHKNRAPVIENIPENITVDEGEVLVLEPVINDYENDDVVVHISEPVGDDGVWETDYDDAGEYEVIISADDGIELVEKSINIVVNDVNLLPVIDVFYPEKVSLEIEENDKALFSVWVSDADNDDLSYVWKINGEEVLSDETEYAFATDYDDAGEYEVCVEVSDGKDVVEQCWHVDVANVNRAPVIKNIIKSIAVKEGELVKIDFTADDADGDALRYKVSQPVGNDLEWQTDYDDAGEYEIIVRVFDGEFEVNESIDIIVEDVNRAPVFSPLEPVVVNEGELFEMQLSAEDADGDELVFSAKDLPKGAELDDSGYFTYVPPYDTAQKGMYWFGGNKKDFVVVFVVSDGYLSVEKDLKITVNDVNLAPVIELINDIVVDEGDVITIKPNVSDADGDDVKISISQPVGNDGVWETDYDDAGEYVVTVTASDGVDEASVDVNVIVNNVNRAPVIEEMKKYEVYENNEIVVEPVVYDPDGDEVELSVSELPENASFEEGKLRWVPDYDASSGEPEEFTVVFAASDGELNSSQEATIVVYNTNRKPEILEARKSHTIAYVGEPVLFVVDAFDADGDELSYTWRFGMFADVEGTAKMRRIFTKPGNKMIKVVVSDGKKEVVQRFAVRIVEKKQAVSKPNMQPKQEMVVSGPSPVKSFYI